MDHDSPSSTRKAVYTIIESSADKKRWVRIGIAFVNRDGSLNVKLDANPISGELHIRDFPPRDSESAVEDPVSPAGTPRPGRRAAA